MINIFYLNKELTEKSATSGDSELPGVYFELLNIDSAVLTDIDLTIYDIEWTSDGITSNLNEVAIEKKITQCDSVRNSVTGKRIVNGFDWPPSGAVRFYLTQENQTNWCNLYVLSIQDKVQYPKTIWSGVEKLQLANKQAVEDFYLAGVAHIELSLDQGLLAKEAFRTMTYEQLKQWLADN
jgi:hypothetical protein